MKTLGQQVREMRKQKGWSMNRLAGEAKVSAGTVWNVEHDRSVEDSSRDAVVEALGGQVQISIVIPQDEPGDPELIESLSRTVRTLPDDRAEAVLSFAEAMTALPDSHLGVILELVGRYRGDQ